MTDFLKLKNWIQIELNSREYNKSTRLDVWAMVMATEKELKKLTAIEDVVND